MLAAELEAGGEAQQFILPDIAGRRDAHKARPALGQGAGLVDDEGIDFSINSRASAFLTRTPTCAPRPVPTMIDIGVARPRAQGQAMMSTATALTSAKPMAGAGPKIDQMM